LSSLSNSASRRWSGSSAMPKSILDGPDPSEEWGFARVGEYLQRWASAEASVDAVIKTVLKLDTLEAAIVSAELPVSGKVRIAIAAVQFSRLGKEDIDKYVKVLNKFLSLTADRNIIAHGFFYTEERVVKFSAKKLNPELVFRELRWPEQDFENKYKQLAEISGNLYKLPPILKNLDLAKILDELSVRPTPGFGLLGLGSLGVPPSPESQNSDPPNATPPPGSRTFGDLGKKEE
jgi:hypothetical protein